MNFTALDFETANASKGSVCSIGLVEYENGELVREYYRLVKPKKNYFAPINVRVHGITKEDVKDAEEFHTLWEKEIKSMVEGKLLIAHNAQFDMGVLRAVLDEYNLPYPMLAYNCTLNISRKTWQLPKYNLNRVADHLGFSFSHHHALEDAKAAAHIFLKAKEKLQASDSRDLVDKSGTTNGMMYEGGYEPARLNKKRRAQKPSASSFSAASVEMDPSHPLYKASVAFTGRLSHMKREEAVQEVVQRGGVFHYDIQASTNYVVVGNKTYERYTSGEKTSKLERTETLLSQGASIEILSEADFLNYVRRSSV